MSLSLYMCVCTLKSLIRRKRGGMGDEGEGGGEFLLQLNLFFFGLDLVGALLRRRMVR